MKFVSVLEKYQELSGKWTVRVDLEECSQFFTFKHEPTTGEIVDRSLQFIADHTIVEPPQPDPNIIPEKSQTLKMFENLYVDFLENMWTNTLREHGVIDANTTITVANTNTAGNIGYLMYLRAVDFDAYDKMSSEFLRLKQMVEESGGDVAKAERHDI